MFRFFVILVLLVPALARAQDAVCVPRRAPPAGFVASVIDEAVAKAFNGTAPQELPDRIATFTMRARAQVLALSQGLQLPAGDIGGYYALAVCRRLAAEGQPAGRIENSVQPLALALSVTAPEVHGGAAKADSQSSNDAVAARAGATFGTRRGAAPESSSPFAASPAPPEPAFAPARPSFEAMPERGTAPLDASREENSAAAGPGAVRLRDLAAAKMEKKARQSEGAGALARQKPATAGDAAANTGRTTVSIDLAGAPGEPQHESRGNAAAGGECAALGVIGPCTDYSSVIRNLRQKPLEYNHPRNMLMGHRTQISLVLRSDWQGAAPPQEVSAELQGLSGPVERGSSKITQIMSARLAGASFEVDPHGPQERLVTTEAPVVWSWFVTPARTGQAQRLKLELYAHVQANGETKPPVLIKTLDASIDVDVTAWDWLVNQARAIEPVYGIAATASGLLVALFGFFYRRIAARRARSLEPRQRYLARLHEG